MSLPLPWVEKIFQKLTLVYGRDFLGRWEGIPLEEVKADWAHELAGYRNSHDALAYALQNLPRKPPTVLEFRAICEAAPRVVKVAQIEKSAGTYTPEVAKKALAEARALLTRMR
jgi:hypothetical protein